MNDNHTNNEYIYKKRWINQVVQSSIKNFPVTVITGARQVGKSTFIKNELDGWQYITLDDMDTLEYALKSPASIVAGNKKIIIDEVQKAPNLLNIIKLEVDKAGDKKYVLSGSANLMLMKQVSETLAGRASYIEMFPMSFGEINDVEKPEFLKSLLDGKSPGIIENEIFKNIDIVSLILKGFMPPLLKLKEQSDFTRWWEGYTATYLERDLRELSQIDSLVDFRRLMKALALRSGNVLNQTEISRDLAMKQPTVYRYLNLLEISLLLEKVPAYSVNRTKRLIKSPKMYWVDPGLASYLSGFFEKEALAKSKEIGSLFECLVFLHLKILSQLTIPKSNIYYWRATTGREVDFVFEYGRKLLAFEVKLSKNVRLSDLENLNIFLEEYPETLFGIVLYNGDEIKILSDKIFAVPWWLITL